MGAPAPPGRRKKFVSDLIYRKMCKCAPRTRSAPPAKARVKFFRPVYAGWFRMEVYLFRRYFEGDD